LMKLTECLIWGLFLMSDGLSTNFRQPADIYFR